MTVDQLLHTSIGVGMRVKKSLRIGETNPGLGEISSVLDPANFDEV